MAHFHSVHPNYPTRVHTLTGTWWTCLGKEKSPPERGSVPVSPPTTVGRYGTSSRRAATWTGLTPDLVGHPGRRSVTLHRRTRVRVIIR